MLCNYCMCTYIVCMEGDLLHTGNQVETKRLQCCWAEKKKHQI